MTFSVRRRLRPQKGYDSRATDFSPFRPLFFRNVRSAKSGTAFANATDEAKLRDVADPVGPDNDKHLLAMVRAASAVIFAYGQPRHRELRERGPALAHMLRTRAGIVPHALRLSRDGTPWHPLYLPETLTPSAWQF